MINLREIKGVIGFYLRKSRRTLFFLIPSLHILYVWVQITWRTLFTKTISNLDVIVIGGSPRSGTTLFRSLLNAHPDITGPQIEFSVIPSIKSRYIWKGLEKMGIKKSEIELIKGARDPIELTEMGLNILKNNSRKPFVAVKAPRHNLFIDKIFKFYPECKYIHLIRDGRDVACSLRRFPKQEIINGELVKLSSNNSFRGCIKRWKYYLERGVKWRGRKNYFEVKYEDLVSNTHEAMKNVCRFLGISPIPHQRLVERYKKERVELSSQTIEVGTEIFNSSIAKWEKEMTDAEKDLFKKLAGDLLIQMKYEDNTDW